MNTFSDFKLDQLVIHAKSGKVYKACDDQMTTDGRLLVIGQRDGKDFGPLRYVAVDQLKAIA